MQLRSGHLGAQERSGDAGAVGPTAAGSGYRDLRHCTRRKPGACGAAVRVWALVHQQSPGAAAVFYLRAVSWETEMIEPCEWYYCPICGKAYRYDDKLRQYVQACDCVWIEETDDTTLPANSTNL